MLPNDDLSHRLRREANAQFERLAMRRWVTDDPAVEVGRQFAPVRVKVPLS